MASYQAPADWEEWSHWLAAGWHGRSRWRLPVLLTGLLFAGVVASWLRAAGVSDDYRAYYALLPDAGIAVSRYCERGDSNPHALRHQILSLARLPIPPLSRWVRAL
jgi:hypothetical protein